MKPEEIEAALLEILKEITADWGLDPAVYKPESRLLGDIGLSSVDALHLMATFNMRYQRSLPFDKLLSCDANYLRNLTVAQMTEFVAENFDQTPQVRPI
jgi:acyl carrier protein